MKKKRLLASALKWLCLVWLLLPVGSVRAEEGVRLGFLFGNTLELQSMSREEARAAMGLWAEELGDHFHVPVQLYFYDSITALRRDFLQQKINMVSSDALSLIRGFSLDELSDGFVSEIRGGWNLELLARDDGPIHGISDLAGKRVAIVDKDPIAALVLENLCLQQFRRECKQVFSEVIKSPSNNQAIMRVYFNQADAVLTYEYTLGLASELNPRIGQKISRVIVEHPLPGWSYALYSSRTSPELRKRANVMIPVLHTYPRGKQILGLFKVDHLSFAKSSDLEPFIELDRENRALRAKFVTNAGK